MAITAKDVKELRERTGAPMMECKKALTDAGGDMDQAIKLLRERGIAKAAKRAGRDTAEGVVAVQVGEGNQGATAVMVCCETDFSARSDAFQELAGAAVTAAASLEPAAAGVEALLESKTPGGQTVKEVLEDTANKIRENMQITEVVRFGGVAGAYTHFDGKQAALVEVELEDPSKAGSEEMTALLRDISMHIVAVTPPPLAVDESGIPEKVLAEEREIFIKQAMDSGKPKEIAEKMVTGRMKKFIAESALLQQPFVKNPEKTIAQVLKEAAQKIGTAIKVKAFRRLSIGG